MDARAARPRAVLICHADDAIDAEGLASWAANAFELAGRVLIHEGRARLWRRVRTELRRVGWWRFLDVLAFRVYYRLRLAAPDAAWRARELARLRAAYPADLDAVATLHVADVNGPAVESFLRRAAPELVIARCKTLLRPALLDIPRAGTYVLHPGICPEYRNAHGCFWALANRDLARVGMTLLRADPGADTGPVLLQSSYAFDERRESPFVVQYRVVLENLDAIAAALRAACRGAPATLPPRTRRSRAWGQPWLSAYLRWQRSLTEART